jgi:hypothetical protein
MLAGGAYPLGQDGTLLELAVFYRRRRVGKEVGQRLAVPVVYGRGVGDGASSTSTP